MSDRIEQAFARNRRRRRVARLIYLVSVIVIAIVLWYFIPKDVIDTIRQTYLNPDAATNLNGP